MLKYTCTYIIITAFKVEQRLRSTFGKFHDVLFSQRSSHLELEKTAQVHYTFNMHYNPPPFSWLLTSGNVAYEENIL